MSTGSKLMPGLKEIEEASKAIQGVASRTPLVESPPLSRLTGKKIYLKLECFQPIKVFKIRGAYNKILRTPERNIVAASSGNHGIAVSYSARLLGKECTVVVPETAVKEKVDAIEGYGAKVLKAGKLSQEREAKAKEIARRTGAAFVHPFDDPEVIAGQGTCGLEISEQLEGIQSVLVPVGGGGLISGISIALKERKVGARVYGVEPAGAPKLTSAMKAKEVVRIEEPKSMADGLIPSALGEITFKACALHVDGAYAVTEDEILEATKVMVNVARIIAEPSGAAPLAPLISGSRTVPGEKVVVVVSGGNISTDLLKRVIE